MVIGVVKESHRDVRSEFTYVRDYSDMDFEEKNYCRGWLQILSHNIHALIYTTHGIERKEEREVSRDLLINLIKNPSTMIMMYRVKTNDRKQREQSLMLYNPSSGLTVILGERDAYKHIPVVITCYWGTPKKTVNKTETRKVPSVMKSFYKNDRDWERFQKNINKEIKIIKRRVESKKISLMPYCFAGQSFDHDTVILDLYDVKENIFLNKMFFSIINEIDEWSGFFSDREMIKEAFKTEYEILRFTLKTPSPQNKSIMTKMEVKLPSIEKMITLNITTKEISFYNDLNPKILEKYQQHDPIEIVRDWESFTSQLPDIIKWHCH